MGGQLRVALAGIGRPITRFLGRVLILAVGCGMSGAVKPARKGMLWHLATGFYSP